MEKVEKRYKKTVVSRVKSGQDVMADKKAENINYWGKLLTFFNGNIKKKFLVLLIISVVLVILSTNFMYPINKAEIITSNITAGGSGSLLVRQSLLEILKSKLMILGLTVIAGVVPYFFIPVLGFIGYVFTTGSEISMKLLGYGGISFSFITLISTVLDIVSISLVTSVGIYFTVVSTKSFTYSRVKRFTFLDLKLQVYEMLKKEDKIKIVKDKIAKRIEKQEKNNVKVKYLEMIGILGVATIIQTISVLIETLAK